MLKKHRLNHSVAISSLWLLALLLSACSGAPAREWLKAPGWSHGLPVGETRISDPVTMALDDKGGIYLFSITAENKNLQPTVTALNRQAEIVWKRTLAIPLTQPDKPTIFWDGQALHLFWLSERALYQAQMDTSGNVIGPVQALSGPKMVDSYDVAMGTDGTLSVWYAGHRRDPGLYALSVGDLISEAVLVDAEGVRPSLQYDSVGKLHAAWSQYPPGYNQTWFFYAEYPDGAYQPGRETAVYAPAIKPTDILSGPWLGLDTQQVYLIWNVTVRTSPEAGASASPNLTEYLYFPQGQPDTSARPQAITAPSVSDLDFTYRPEGGLAAGLRVFPSQGPYPNTAAVRDVTLNTAPGPEQELALAFDVMVLHEFRKERGQIGAIFLQNGKLNGYQLLSFTPKASVDPAIVSDETRQLYLTWLERGEDGGFQVYFASTASDIQAALSRATWGDIGRIGRETIFGLLSGAVLAPVVVMLWLILPLLILFLTSFLRRRSEDKLTSPGTMISLLLAAAIYWGAKLLTIPGIGSFIPFAAWVPAIPTWLQAPLQIGVPVAITIAAIRVAWHFTYRRRATSLLYFAFLYAAVDGVLTMAIYGFLFYNLV